MSSSTVVTVVTDAGMLAMWRGSAFQDVVGYDAWEMKVNDRLDEAIRAGELVPIGVQADGAFGVRVAVSPDSASPRESRYTLVVSDPYLLVSDGSPTYLGGLEAVGDAASNPITVHLPPGRFCVRVALVAWDDEPGARGPDGRPVPGALEDFLVSMTPSTGDEVFRTSEFTFDPPEPASESE